MKKQVVIQSAIFLFLFAFLAACGGKQTKTISTLNSDVLHTENGFMLLERKHYGLAKREFNKAIKFNKEYSRAYMGKAVVYLHQNMLNEAHKELQKALKYAKTKEDTLKVKSGMIQFYSSNEFVGRHHGKNAWFIMAKEVFDDAQKAGKSNEVYYYMAIAHSLNFQFNDAQKLLDEIIKTENPFTLRAKEEKSRINSIKKIVEKYKESRGIIFDEFLTRGQLSFVLVDLFKLDKKLQGNTSSLKLVAKDSLGSLYADSILKVIALKLNGLAILRDKTFRPNKRISRAELSYVLNELKGRLHIQTIDGIKKKFSDVNPEDWFYESVQFVGENSFLTEQDSLTMEFRPLDGISTLEAIQALDRLLSGI